MKISIKKKMITTALFSTLVAASFSTLAAEGDWLVRFGAVNVAPNDSSNPDLVAVESNAQAFVNFSYMLKSNIAIEVLAATPFTHDIVGSGVLAASGKLGETQQLPPTVSVQYHFKPTANIRPYVGAGINYTAFFSEKATNVITELKLDDSFGLAVQAGVDIDINKDWFFNADVRYINIETTAVTDAGDIDVEINPTVISLGVGTRF